MQQIWAAYAKGIHEGGRTLGIYRKGEEENDLKEKNLKKFRKKTVPNVPKKRETSNKRKGHELNQKRKHECAKSREQTGANRVEINRQRVS